MDDYVREAVSILGLRADFALVAEKVARDICDFVRKEARARIATPTEARRQLEAVARHAELLRRALEKEEAREGLRHAHWGRDESADAPEADRALAAIPRLIGSRDEELSKEEVPGDLSRDLQLIELSAREAINKLGLAGRRGKVKTNWTYRLGPVQIFALCVMRLWMVAKQTDRKPSEKNAEFCRFLAELAPAALPKHDEGDFARSIRVARFQDQTRGREVAHLGARLKASSLVQPLINKINESQKKNTDCR
ncbi:MAG: hypothetical protein FJX42_08030 [Alphaproteobacteria bacterium]|nr:hypothetical protein [Alphaproteobacteria bacterium]